MTRVLPVAREPFPESLSLPLLKPLLVLVLLPVAGGDAFAQNAAQRERLADAKEVLARVDAQHATRIDALLPRLDQAGVTRLKDALQEFDKASTWWNSMRSASNSALMVTGGGLGWLGAGGLATYASGFLTAIPLVGAGILVGAGGGAAVSSWMHYQIWRPRAVAKLDEILKELERQYPAIAVVPAPAASQGGPVAVETAAPVSQGTAPAHSAAGPAAAPVSTPPDGTILELVGTRAGT